jgi:hypothetical protein
VFRRNLNRFADETLVAALFDTPIAWEKEAHFLVVPVQKGKAFATETGAERGEIRSD